MDKYIVPQTVSEAILDQESKFTDKDIFNVVKEQLKVYFKNTDEMKNYIRTKLNSMTELGLVGRTSCYYFPI